MSIQELHNSIVLGISFCILLENLQFSLKTSFFHLKITCFNHFRQKSACRLEYRLFESHPYLFSISQGREIRWQAYSYSAQAKDSNRHDKQNKKYSAKWVNIYSVHENVDCLRSMFVGGSGNLYVYRQPGKVPRIP